MSDFDFETVLTDVGEFGPFQIRLFLLVSMFETPAAWAIFLPVFTSAEPTWRCPNYSLSGTNVTEHDRTAFNMTSIYDEMNILNNNASNRSQSACSADGSEICPGIQYNSDFTSIISEWGLLCMPYLAPLITTIQMVGVLVGACVTGQLADTFGRRLVFYVVYSLMLLSVLISAFCHTWQFYMVMRIFVGVFFGGTMVINFVLPMEFVGRQWRTFCGCIGFWACGVMSLALLAYLFRDWRHLTIACAVGGIPLLFSWRYVMESPRWLIQKGRLKEAENIVRMIAKFNKKVVREMDVGVQKAKIQHERYSYWDLFRTPEMAKNTLVVMYAWFVSSAVYYGMTFNASSLYGDRYVNLFLSGMVEIPAVIFVVLVNNKLGRKWTQILLFTIASFCCFGIMIMYLVDWASVWVQVLALLGKWGVSGGWAAAQVFSAELFPTVVRNIGIGASSMSARIGGIVAPQIIRLNQFSGITVFGVLCLVVSVSMLLVPETAKKPLQDSLPEKSCLLCLPLSQHRKDGNTDRPVLNEADVSLTEQTESLRAPVASETRCNSVDVL